MFDGVLILSVPDGTKVVGVANTMNELEVAMNEASTTDKKLTANRRTVLGITNSIDH